MHLTNYSLNKNSADFLENDDINSTEGHKWSLTALYGHVQNELGVDVDKVKRDINDIVNKTLICTDHIITGKLNSLRIPKGVCYEVFGFDILLDAVLKPWLIEVNVMPSLASTSEIDRQIKNQLIADLNHVLGFQPYDRKQFASDLESEKERRLVYGKSGEDTGLKRRNLFEMAALSLEEFEEEELEVIMECEDESHRKGHFEMTFPCDNMDRYMKFFSTQRYNNIILATWYRNKEWSILEPYLARYPVAMKEDLIKADSKAERKEIIRGREPAGSRTGAPRPSSGSRPTSASTGGRSTRSKVT